MEKKEGLSRARESVQKLGRAFPRLEKSWKIGKAFSGLGKVFTTTTKIGKAFPRLQKSWGNREGLSRARGSLYNKRQKSREGLSKAKKVWANRAFPGLGKLFLKNNKKKKSRESLSKAGKVWENREGLSRARESL